MNEEEIKKDIEKYKEIEIILSTNGGKQLKEYLEETFVSLLDTLLNKYKVMGSIELIPIIAQIDATLQLLRKLTGAKKEKDNLLSQIEK